MNMRSIYANPYKYACTCSISFELAKIMCKKQRHFYKEQKKHPMYCPVCKSKHLTYEGGSWEEGYDEFIECADCGETFDCGDVPNVEYASLTGWENFDPVLFYSHPEEPELGWQEACGATTQEEWMVFATQTITGKKGEA